MRKRPTPDTLYDACVQQAQEEHARRLKELKAMRASLALLDPLVPALKSRGLELYVSGMRWVPADRALDATVSYFMARQANIKLYDALVDLGFKVIRHDNVCSWSTAILKRGRLALRIGELPPLPKPDTVTDANAAVQAAWSAGA